MASAENPRTGTNVKSLITHSGDGPALESGRSALACGDKDIAAMAKIERIIAFVFIDPILTSGLQFFKAPNFPRYHNIPRTFIIEDEHIQCKRPNSMIIAQITDIHLGFEGPEIPCENTLKLRAVIKDLEHMQKKPDLVLITGDLTESGETWAYEALKRELKALSCPYYLGLGNHDRRAVFTQCFPEFVMTDGFLHYEVTEGPLRILMLDTLEEGRHGGGFCPARAAWLRAELGARPDVPTFIAMHHAPIDTAIAWMTSGAGKAWVKALRAVVTDFDNIQHVTCGHIHRPIFTRFGKTTLSVCPAVAPQVHLDLASIDPDVPDNRVLLRDELPGFALHVWDGTAVTTHMGTAPAGPPIVRFDQDHVSVVKHTLDLDQ